MTKSESIFEAELIDSGRYKKLKNVRYTLYSILVICFIFQYAWNANNQSLIEFLGVSIVPFWGFILILISASIVLYFYSNNIRRFGKISFQMDKIEIQSENENKTHFLKNISNLEVERGADFHHSKTEDGHTETFDNWIIFNEGGNKYEYEFEINSSSQNNNFEKMLQVLKRERVKYSFTSI